jgi:aspartate racemase
MKANVIGFFLIALTAEVLLSEQSPQLPPASDMKTLGLVGGTSWYSTVEYYRYINKAVNDAYGNGTNPPLLLYNSTSKECMTSRRGINGTRSLTC